MTDSVESQVRAESTLGALPVTRDERLWGFWDYTWLNVSLAIATWAFLIGGSTALMVGFSEGIAALLIGNTIGGAIMLLGGPIMTQRYGIEHFTLLRSALGKVGVAIMVFVVVLVVGVGWHSILGLMVGRAFVQVSNQAFGTGFDINGAAVTAVAILALFVAWLIVSRGPKLIGRLNRFIAPGLILVTVLMIVMLFMHTTLAELGAAAPLAPFEDPRLSFAMAVEFNVGAGIAWWQTIGSFGRLTKSPRTSVWGAYVGLLFGSMIAGTVGLAAALALGESDPPAWMVPLGGPVVGVLVLAFVGFANITSVASAAYPTVLAIKQAGGRALERVRWPVITGAYILLTMILACFPVLMVEKFQLFVTLSGGVLASVCGVIAADYLVLRRQAIEIRELFAPIDRSAYRFNGGVNLGALLAMVAGVVTFMYLFNPITLETREPFALITASIPAVAVAAIVHLIAAWLLYRRRGLGGYGARDPFTAPASAAAPASAHIEGEHA